MFYISLHIYFDFNKDISGSYIICCSIGDSGRSDILQISEETKVPRIHCNETHSFNFISIYIQNVFKLTKLVYYTYIKTNILSLVSSHDCQDISTHQTSSSKVCSSPPFCIFIHYFLFFLIFLSFDIFYHTVVSPYSS